MGGAVYLAQDTKLDHKLAIKLLSDDFNKDPDRLNRLTQEAQAASVLIQPNILTIYKVGETEAWNYHPRRKSVCLRGAQEPDGPLSGGWIEVN